MNNMMQNFIFHFFKMNIYIMEIIIKIINIKCIIIITIKLIEIIIVIIIRIKLNKIIMNNNNA
jgi:hypothetical protein